jgi:hypothetical protein
MTGNERIEDSIARWLQEAAPTALPQRVLATTFDRTRRTRQDSGWRAALGRPHLPRFIPALGGAAAVVVAVVLALNVGLVSVPGEPTTQPSPAPTVTPATSGSMWPQSSLEEVQAAQRLADAGDPGYTWQVAPDLEAHLGQGGPYREEIFRRFLEEKLGWEDFAWTLGGGSYEGRAGVFFLRCAPDETNAFLGGECEPTMDQLRYETVNINVAQLDRQGPTGIWVVSSWEMIEPFERPAPPEAHVVELMNGFLEARVAGEGAQPYLDIPEEDVPLLYTTTSGSPYERGGFEEVRGYDWPYGLRAFIVWLEVDGLVVVNQLFFMPPDGRPRLDYVPDGYGTDIAPTTENGQPVARLYEAFDGQVTLQVAHPWVSLYASPAIRLIPDAPGLQPTTDGGERHDWDRLALVADPVPVGMRCHDGAPADAEALAESIRSLPFLEATAPVALTAGASDALMMDMVTGARSGCAEALYDQQCPGFQSRCKMRLYLFDVPEGLSMRILAIGVIAPELDFLRAVDAATPIIDSIEFHVP